MIREARSDLVEEKGNRPKKLCQFSQGNRVLHYCTVEGTHFGQTEPLVPLVNGIIVIIGSRAAPCVRSHGCSADKVDVVDKSMARVFGVRPSLFRLPR